MATDELMRRTLRLALLAALITPLFVHADPPRRPAPWRAEMTPFRSEAALRAWARGRGRSHVVTGGIFAALGGAGGIVSPFGGMTESGAPAPSITNNQVQGVDEGDIVKASGDHLVILRRGRLFSVRVAEGEARPVSMVDVAPPGVTAADWYDEMLLDGDTVVVLGYDYDDTGTGTTQVLRFDLSRDGALSFRDVRYLRSGDYYSSRNYATRLVGHTLVTYLPVPLFVDDARGGSRVSIPSIRVGRDGGWTSVMDWARVYRPSLRTPEYPTMHTVLFCDLDQPDAMCRAEGLVAGEGRSFYVSASAVYLWVDVAEAPNGLRPRGRPAPAIVYRFPLDGGLPGAVAVRGGPVDQFSFHERDGALHVVLRAEADGDAMWRPEVTRGDVAVARVPLWQFSVLVTELPEEAYTSLARPTGEGPFHNRFIGDRLVYGVGTGWGPAASAGNRAAYVHRLGRTETTALTLRHGVDRIEPIGRDAVVIGSEGNDLYFSSVALDDRPAVVDTLLRARAAEAETRSHGFFYRAQGDRRGLLGLPLRSAGGQWSGPFTPGAAEVLWLRADGLRLTPLGSLASHAAEGGATDDQCVASCVDWYGNARPIFFGERLFALMGYELVEGTMREGRITERARVDLHRALAAR